MKKLIKIVRYCAIIFTITPLVVMGEVCRFGGCTPSSEMETDIKPGVYPSYNDLTRPVGVFEDEYLEKVLLRGVVVDKKCIPVPNTKLLLWQNDEYGKRRYLKKFASEQDRHIMNDQMHGKFVGAGSTLSDSEGRFFFITVDPGSKEKGSSKSKINISALGKGLISFETQIKLSDTIIDKKKNFITALFNKSASDHYGQKVYDFFIVLNGNSRYNKY
jgi:protocatechuate 3,4-dioxygenase beta subunit